MSKIVLKTENLGISFGGLKAVQELNLEIKEYICYTVYDNVTIGM